jgi:Kdo2-lipid IVA lauroyltransferase/acyltransferase
MAARKKTGARAYLTYLLVRLLIFIIRFTPWSLCRLSATIIGRLGSIFDKRHRQLALEAVARSLPEKTPAEQLAIVRGCYRHLCLAAFEIAKIANMSREAVARIWVPDQRSQKTLDTFEENNEAVIFVAGHVGLWEMYGIGHTARGGRLATLARPQDNLYLEDLVKSIRQRFGQKMLGKLGALRGALHALREGTSIGMVLDQNAGKLGVFVPLFGRLASTMPTAAQIALHYGVKIVFVHSWRDEKAGLHRMQVGDIIETEKWTGPRDQSYDQEMLRITADYTRQIEAAVRKHPKQWFWLHRRWKTRPPEESQNPNSK